MKKQQREHQVAPITTSWQPIDTAPRDGSPVLVTRKDWELPAFVQWHVKHRRAKRACWDWMDELDGYQELMREPPTHWLPIPLNQE